jgi:hypothetical protein
MPDETLDETPDEVLDDTSDEAAVGEPDVRAAMESGRRRGGAAGAMLAGAMVAMRDILEEKPKQEIPIEVEAAGEPHDVDRDGVQLAVGEVEVSAPALERIEPLAPPPKRKRR